MCSDIHWGWRKLQRGPFCNHISHFSSYSVWGLGPEYQAQRSSFSQMPLLRKKARERRSNFLPQLLSQMIGLQDCTAGEAELISGIMELSEGLRFIPENTEPLCSRS